MAKEKYTSTPSLSYFPRFFRPPTVLEGIAPGTSEHATRGFGLSAWYRLYDKSAKADALVREIVERDPENSFGRIAAEVDQKRATGK